MKINGAKCKIISPSDQAVVLDGSEVEHVKEFVFLGSVVPNSSDDVRRRISLASAAFGRLKIPIWQKREISKPLKVRLYKALILPIATYAAETWTIKSEDSRKLEAFEMRCMRAISGVKLRDRVRNETVRTALHIDTTITDIIKTKRLKWFSHVARRPAESYVARAYHLDFPNPRPRGRPPKKWCTQIREDTGLPLATAERRASERLDWRREVTERARFRRGIRP